MANPVSIKIDSAEFTETLRRYAALSRRMPADICNKKAYYIVRRAIWYTPKAEYAKMASEIGPTARAIEIREGKVKHGKTIWAQSANAAQAPALALIINRRRGLKGKPGLYGASMQKAVKNVWGARARSIAYIKSGWITARDKFRRLIKGIGGLPPDDRKAKQYGRPKGWATAAVETRWSTRADFANTATTKRDHKDALIKYGAPALEKAFNEERISMLQEIERRLDADARACGIHTRKT